MPSARPCLECLPLSDFTLFGGSVREEGVPLSKFAVAGLELSTAMFFLGRVVLRLCIYSQADTYIVGRTFVRMHCPSVSESLFATRETEIYCCRRERVF